MFARLLLGRESIDLLARLHQAAVVLLSELSANLVEGEERRGSVNVGIRSLFYELVTECKQEMALSMVEIHTSPPEGLPGIDGDAELFLVNGGVSMRRPNLSVIPRAGGDVTLLSGTLLGCCSKRNWSLRSSVRLAPTKFFEAD